MNLKKQLVHDRLNAIENRINKIDNNFDKIRNKDGGICTHKIGALSQLGAEKSRFPLNVVDGHTDRQTYIQIDGRTDGWTSVFIE